MPQLGVEPRSLAALGCHRARYQNASVARQFLTEVVSRLQSLAPEGAVGLRIHGLIFETSISRLAGSTRHRFYTVPHDDCAEAATVPHVFSGVGVFVTQSRRERLANTQFTSIRLAESCNGPDRPPIEYERDADVLRDP